MVSIHQSDADADQNKTRFVVVWICIFDSSDYSRKIVPTFGAWTRFFLSESYGVYWNRKNDRILIITPEKQDKTLELSEHWSVDSTLARNEVIMKRTYPVKSVKCDKICSNC